MTEEFPALPGETTHLSYEEQLQQAVDSANEWMGVYSGTIDGYDRETDKPVDDTEHAQSAVWDEDEAREYHNLLWAERETALMALSDINTETTRLLRQNPADAAVYSRALRQARPKLYAQMVETVEQDASSPAAAAAIRVALDYSLLMEAAMTVGLKSGHKKVEELLPYASSPAAVQTIRRAVDSHIFKLAEEEYSAKPDERDRRSLRRRLDRQASTKEDAADMWYMLKWRAELGGRRRSEEQDLGGAALGGAGIEGPGEDPATAEARAVMARLRLGTKREFAFLQREDPRHVQRVIDQVHSMRAEADAAGQQLSTLDVYRRFHEAVDLSTDRSSQVDPTARRSLHILQACLNGDVRRGELPF